MNNDEKIIAEAELSSVLGDVVSIQGRPALTINGLRKLARRAGVVASVKCYVAGKSGEWREFLIDEKTPIAAKAVVELTNGQRIEKVVKWSEFAKNSGVWLTSPEQMLTKVAEAHALRQAIAVSPQTQQFAQIGISAEEHETAPAQAIARPNVVKIEAKKEPAPATAPAPAKDDNSEKVSLVERLVDENPELTPDEIKELARQKWAEMQKETKKGK